MLSASVPNSVTTSTATSQRRRSLTVPTRVRTSLFNLCENWAMIFPAAQPSNSLVSVNEDQLQLGREKQVWLI